MKNNTTLPEGYCIEPVCEVDIDFIMAIETACFPSQWNKETYFTEIKREMALFYVVRFDSEVVAYSLSWMVAGELHVLKIATHPDHMRKGLALAMMEKTLEKAIKGGCENAYLEVREANVAAKTLYEGLGFRVIGIRKGYYQDTGENAFVLFRPLGTGNLD